MEVRFAALAVYYVDFRLDIHAGRITLELTILRFVLLNAGHGIIIHVQQLVVLVDVHIVLLLILILDVNNRFELTLLAAVAVLQAHCRRVMLILIRRIDLDI